MSMVIFGKLKAAVFPQNPKGDRGPAMSVACWRDQRGSTPPRAG